MIRDQENLPGLIFLVGNKVYDHRPYNLKEKYRVNDLKNISKNELLPKVNLRLNSK